MEQSAANRISQVHEDSIRRLDGGGIPTFALERLRALRGSASALFITTLSVDEFALTRATGLRPLSQVMGVCVSESFAPWWPQRVNRETWNTPRNKAVHRMSLEAQTCGAHLVTGVRIKRSNWSLEVESGAAARQFVATGTAMLYEGAGPASEDGPDTVLTTLSAQDHWKLVQHGFDPLGVVACTIGVAGQPSAATLNGVNWGNLAAEGRQNRETPEFSALITDAYSNAMTELRDQASRLGAAGIVGIQIDRSHHTVDRSNYNQVVMVDAIGTAVAAKRPAGSGAVSAALPVQPVRRLDMERRQSR
jgi:uncharacterized protein YbjQ (UPF0145 family)